MKYRMGTDIGGTFTDLTISQGDELVGKFKSPTTPARLYEGVLDCVEQAATSIGLSSSALLSDTEVFVHGSTVATNAVLEGKVARCGVICTRGTRYTLWRGEGRRSNIFDFTNPADEPLVPPSHCVEVGGRIDRNGSVVEELNEDQVIEAIHQLQELGCEAVAICLLWSIRNDAHERAIARLLGQHLPNASVSLSSEVQPVLREYTRMSCTALNAMLQPGVSAYLEQLREVLENNGLTGELLVVASDGGVQPVSEIAKRPVYMLFSGPATGPSAALQIAASENREDCLLVDMGGTSFDVSTVLDGKVSFTRDGRIDNYPTGLAAVEILTLGAGGGSIAHVDAGGLLRVGPRSAGARPGPACYGRGGTEPTVTDAYLVLGYLVADRFLGGRMTLSMDAAQAAIQEHIATKLELSVIEAARGIVNVVNEYMASGILQMTVRRGIDPRSLTMVTGGGATGVAAVQLARELGIERVIVPRETSVLCAYGALNADLRWSSVANSPTTSRNFALAPVQAAVEEMLNHGTDFLENSNVPVSQRQFELAVAARYPQQVTDLDIPCPNAQLSLEDAKTIAEKFHHTYRARYAVAEPDSDVEFVMWRLSAIGARPAIRRQVAVSASKSRETHASNASRYFYDPSSGRHIEADLLDLESLEQNAQLKGPALIVSSDTAIVLPTGSEATVAAEGHLVIDVKSA
jgi:N-methylhydantoinase A